MLFLCGLCGLCGFFAVSLRFLCLCSSFADSLGFLCFHLNFSGNFDVTTPIGSFQAGGQLGLGAPQGNGLLTNAVIALGVLSLVNTVATVASGWFGNKDDEGDKDEDKDGNYDLFVIASKTLLKKSFIIIIGKLFETMISSVL